MPSTPGRWAWARQVFTMEFRNNIAYRSDFWVQFLFPAAGNLGIAYFLWRAVFEARGTPSLGGYSFHGLMFYYLLVSFVDRMVGAQAWSNNSLSNDIYDGSLSRYLVYPIPLFIYRYIVALTGALFSLVQMGLGIAIFLACFGLPADSHLSLTGGGLGLLSMLFSLSLFYLMFSIIELVAFWADNIWSLQVMLRFAMNLLGGFLIPLTLFPDWAQRAIRWMPFPGLVSLPVRLIMGQAGLSEWLRAEAVTAGWLLVFGAILAVVWRRGLRGYTGVGI